jgi:hypothetical protein
MDISSIAPVIAIALIVIGGTIFVVRQWRRLKAADTRFYAERAELDQKWEYLFQLWREEREREEREREEWRREQAEWMCERTEWRREREEASRPV